MRRPGCWPLAWLAAIALLLLLVPGIALRAQGCSACRDMTAGSTPKAREGLRRAVWVLGVPAGGIFVAVLVLARRMDRHSNIYKNPAGSKESA